MTVEGIDLHWQKPLPTDLSRFKFVGLKKSQGESWQDPAFPERAEQLDDDKYLIIYHWFETEDEHTVQEQAQNFLKDLEKYDVQELYLDVENYQQILNGNEAEWLWELLHTLQAAGYTVGIYTSWYMWNVMMEQNKSNKAFCDTHDFGIFNLWVANWDVDQPMLPTPWTEWRFWQDGHITINGQIYDHNVFNGDSLDLPPTDPTDPVPLYMLVSSDKLTWYVAAVTQDIPIPGSGDGGDSEPTPPTPDPVDPPDVYDPRTDFSQKYQVIEDKVVLLQYKKMSGDLMELTEYQPTNSVSSRIVFHTGEIVLATPGTFPARYGGNRCDVVIVKPGSTPTGSEQNASSPDGEYFLLKKIGKRNYIRKV